MPVRRRIVTVGVTGVLVVCGVSFAGGNLGMLRTLADGVATIDLRLAALGLACSVVAIVNRGLLNRAAHRAAGLDASVAAMTRTAAVGFAAQKLVKSAGAVGLAVFVRHGRRRGHAPGSVTAACVLTAAGSFVALGVLLGVAVAVLAATGRLTGWWIAAAAGFAIYAVAVAAFAVVVVRSRRAAVAIWRAGQRLRLRVLGRRAGRGSTADVPNELFDAIESARRRPEAVRRLLLHAVASKLLGALMLACAVAATGLPLSPSGALVIYATALGASMVTIVPGGIGTVEASTAALLVAAGATAGAAMVAIALFRLFDLWTPVAIGAIAARRDSGDLEGESRVDDPALVQPALIPPLQPVPA